MIIFKWNELICCGGGGGGGGGGAGGEGSAGSGSGEGGTGGSGGNAGQSGAGDGGQGQSEASIAADPDTGNFGGMATGLGQDGYGGEGSGQPGILGGGVLGGIPSGLGQSPGAAVGDMAASLGIGMSGQIGQGTGQTGSAVGGSGVGGLGATVGADPVSSGDPTSAGFGGTVAGGSLGEGNMGMSAAMSFGANINSAIESGNITPEQGNQAIASADLGIMGTAAANFGAAMASISGTLGTALSAISSGLPIGMGLTSAIGLASLAAAVTGQGMLGASPESGVVNGPGFMDLVNKGQEIANSNGIDVSEVFQPVEETTKKDDNNYIQIGKVNSPGVASVSNGPQPTGLLQNSGPSGQQGLLSQSTPTIKTNVYEQLRRRNNV